MKRGLATGDQVEKSGTPAGSGRRRTGEKVGWTGGWLGGFLWLLILSALRLAQGRVIEGLTGVGLFVLAVGAVLFLAPWRHPSTRYWRLTVPIYLLFFSSVAWAVWTSGGLEQLGLNWWSFFWILPCLLPLWTVGGKRWEERDG